MTRAISVDVLKAYLHKHSATVECNLIKLKRDIEKPSTCSYSFWNFQRAVG